jgi:hypothetical protein
MRRVAILDDHVAAMQDTRRRVTSAHFIAGRSKPHRTVEEA